MSYESALLAGPRRVVHVGDGAGVFLSAARFFRPSPERPPVHRAEHGEFGLCPVAGERAVRHRLVQVALPARDLHQAGVARDRGQHPRLHLVGVGHHEPPARVGDYGTPDHLGDLQAPPPLVTQRPVTVPPGRYSGPKRPSRTQSWSQDQPCATQIRYSFLY